METSGPSVYQVKFDNNIFQGHDPICAIRCQEMILRDYGIQIPKEELIDYASKQGWYDNVKGTRRRDVGNLLETCNVGTHTKRCDSVYDIIDELKEGHRVIVAVDSHELWAKPGSEEYEFYRNNSYADHVLLVTSVYIDPENSANSTVVLTDPGNGSVKEYNLEHFVQSWKDSKCYMMATDEPAPYQYNPETASMEFSNFATEFSIREFPFHNEFSSIWEIDEKGYVPYYKEGHLYDITEKLSYENFQKAYSTDSLDDLDNSFNMSSVDSFFETTNQNECSIAVGIMPNENWFDYGYNNDNLYGYDDCEC